MAGFENDIMFAKNGDFTQADNQAPTEANGLFTNGQLWIGTTAANVGGTHINVGSVTSSTLTVGYSSPNITINTPGGGSPIEKVALQTGTTPIVPLAGTITFNGSTVAAGTNPVRTNGTGANTMALQVQTSQALAAADATKIGLSNFNSTNFNVDSTGFVTGVVAPVFGATNLGISYAAGTFTITAANGTALSATNFAYATLPSNTNAGQQVTLQINTPYTFTDAAGTNDIGANLFGITAGVAWANDCPFYLYIVANNGSPQNDIAFAISRVPNLLTSPAVGNLSIAGDTAASTQSSMFLLKKNGSTVTKTNFASQPCVSVGSFRMRATTTPAWTVQALSLTGDGIGNFNLQTTFTYPVAQNGAVVTHFVQDANAPVWSTKIYTYMVTRSGLVSIALFYSNLTSNGTTATLYKPTVPLTSATTYNQLVGWYGTGSVNPVLLANSWTSPSSNMELKSNGAATSLRQQDVAGTSVTAQFGLNFSYQL